jgi:hypothetical protein
MRTSFLHLADTRLGFRDPADPTVFERVAKQFRFAVDFAIDQRASFVVFSGNLFTTPDVGADTLQVALRGLGQLAEKNIGAIAIRGRGELRGQPSVMSWHELLAQQGLLASLETSVGNGEVELRRWDRRAGSGSYMDLGRCRVFGLHYFGSMTGPLLQAMAKSLAALDNREMDFRILLLHAPLEHFSGVYGPHLSYADLLMLRRQLDYVALGGCDQKYEAEGWVYNPGSDGFYHVTVDTAVQPKHVARFVAYPGILSVSRPAPPLPRSKRSDIEDRVLGELLKAGGGSSGEQVLRGNVLRLVTQSMWGAADVRELHARLLELAGQEPEDGHAA